MESIIREALKKKPQLSEPVRRKIHDFSADDEELKRILSNLKTDIKIIGCGGAGNNTIQRCLESGINDVDLISVNTDAQHLLNRQAHKKILIGKKLTRGLGAGSVPEIGERAAEESKEEIASLIANADIVFLTCGLGGGTGTGAIPVLAQLAKEQNSLTIAIVTYPFRAEGTPRMLNADKGLEKLRKNCDTVIVIPNDKLLEIVPTLPISKAFEVADEILMRSIQGITEMITKPSLINLDYADLRAVMKDGGVAMIGIGEGNKTENKALEAVNEALNSPLLDVDISDAKGALVNVVGGATMNVAEAEMVMEEVHSRISPSAQIIWGTRIDDSLGDAIQVMLVVTGVSSQMILGPRTEKGGPKSKLEKFGIDVVKGEEKEEVRGRIAFAKHLLETEAADEGVAVAVEIEAVELSQDVKKEQKR